MKIIEKKMLDNISISSEALYINQSISMSEIEPAVSMKNNKAPGPDGIPAIFFKAFFKPKDSYSSQTDSFAENKEENTLPLFI